MISQELQQRLELRLSPQQLQFLKLLQQPLLTLEQSIKQELELNPVLEEIEEEISELSDEQPVEAEEQKEEENIEEPEEDDFNLEDLLDDDTTGYKSSDAWSGDTERDEMPLEEHITLAEALREQLHLLSLSEEELHLADEIIGNLDEDGYLRQTLEDILASANISLSLEHAEKILKHIQRLE
ncbi:MAG: RNA polymerase sigma-54 factor, partial [Ignavibacteriales bacterium]|nr:RNA polymerase sigma-54 factor [Ignavibacteriales bacterium]